MSEDSVRAVYLGDIHSLSCNHGIGDFDLNDTHQVGIFSTSLLTSDLGLTDQQLACLRKIRSQFKALIIASKESHYFDTNSLNGYVDSIIYGVSAQTVVAELVLLSESEHSCKAFALTVSEAFKRQESVMAWRYRPQNFYSLMSGKTDEDLNKLFRQFDANKRVILYGKVFENQTFELWMALCERVNDFCEEFIAVADYAPVNNDGFVIVEV